MRATLDAVFLGLAFCLFANGCGGLASMTSGRIGCPSDEITIADDELHWDTNARAWTAECRGRRYYCSAGGGSAKHSSTEVDCTEEAREADSDSREDTSTTSPAGRQYDNQCKGDRVCVDGQCVSPGKDSDSESSDDAAPSEED